MKKHYTRFTEKDFNKIKLLEKAGLTIAQTSEISGRAASLVSAVKKMNVWQDYIDFKADRLEKIHAAKLNSKMAEAELPWLPATDENAPAQGTAAGPAATDVERLTKATWALKYSIDKLVSRLDEPATPQDNVLRSRSIFALRSK